MSKYLTRKTYEEIELNDEVLLLADIPGVKVGTTGIVVDFEEERIDEHVYRGIKIHWTIPERSGTLPLRDSISESLVDLILAFKTAEPV